MKGNEQWVKIDGTLDIESVFVIISISIQSLSHVCI